MFDALTAAEQLAGEGIEVEVLDLRTLVPLDTDRMLESVGKTKRAVVAHYATTFAGPGAEVAATICRRSVRRAVGSGRAGRSGFHPDPFGPGARGGDASLRLVHRRRRAPDARGLAWVNGLPSAFRSCRWPPPKRASWSGSWPTGPRSTEGEALYVIETDKVETEIEAATSGVIHHGAEAGQTYPVGTEIATIEGTS